MFLNSYNLNAPATISATTTLQAIDCERMSHISFQVTQTAAGVSFALNIQASNDGINWATTTATTPITGAGTVILERTGCASRWYRAQLVATSGTLTGVTAVASGMI